MAWTLKWLLAKRSDFEPSPNVRARTLKRPPGATHRRRPRNAPIATRRESSREQRFRVTSARWRRLALAIRGVCIKRPFGLVVRDVLGICVAIAMAV